MTIDNEYDARKLARVIVSDIKLYNAEKIAKGKELSDEIAEARALFARRVDPSLHTIFEEAIVRSKLARRAPDRPAPAPAVAPAPAKAQDPLPPPTPPSHAQSHTPLPRPPAVLTERSSATPEESPVLQPTDRPTPVNVAPPASALGRLRLDGSSMGIADEVEVCVTPTAGDAIVSCLLSLQARPKVLAAFLAFFVGLPWTYVAIAVALGRHRDLVTMAALPILALGVFFAGIPLLSYVSARRSPSFGEIRHRFTDEGIISSGRGWSRTVQWSAISACTVWRGAVLLRSGPSPLFFFPARATPRDLLTRIQRRVGSNRDA